MVEKRIVYGWWALVACVLAALLLSVAAVTAQGPQPESAQAEPASF